VTLLLAGAVLGLAGSIHCAGMCGPLLLAVARGASRAALVRRMSLYHAARICTYALLGIPAGYAGRAGSFGLFGRTVAFTGGILLVAAASGALFSRHGRSASHRWSLVIVRAGAAAAKLTRRHSHLGPLALGAVNGLLPCGLVYAAAAAAAATGTVNSAVTFMIAFGAGTVPLLFALTVSAAAVPATMRHRLRFLAPALMALAGLLLIVRAFVGIHPGEHHQHMPTVSLARCAPLAPRGI
jgi:uncharacterized protein